MKTRFRKALRWLGIVSGALFLLLALFLVEEHIRGRIALNRWMAQMKARGEKFSIEELAPAPVPPERNGAGLLLAAGFGGGKVAPYNVPAAMGYVAAGKTAPMVNYPAWSIKKQYELRLNTNGVTALWRTNTSTETPVVRGERIPMLITKEDLAADIAAASNSFERVFTSLSYSNWDFGVSYSQGMAITVAHLIRVKAPALWMRAASLSALYETNLDASLENLLGIASLSQVLTNEPLMISQLVRIAIFQIGASAVWEALQIDGWTDQQLAALQTAYGAFEPMPLMERMFGMERAFGLHSMDQAFNDLASFMKGTGQLNLDFTLLPSALPEDFGELFDPAIDSFKSLIPLFNRFVYLPVWKFAWKDQDKLHLLQYWQRCITECRSQSLHPDWSRATTAPRGNYREFFALDPDGENQPGSIYDRARFLLSSLLGNTGERTLRRAVQAATAREIVVTAIALRRFELAHNKLPATLDELIPSFLSRAPLDLFDGKALRYRRETNGAFVLYSVGNNCRDDGGNGASETPSGRPTFLNARDMVWPQAATPEEVLKVR